MEDGWGICRFSTVGEFDNAHVHGHGLPPICGVQGYEFSAADERRREEAEFTATGERCEASAGRRVRPRNR